MDESIEIVKVEYSTETPTVLGRELHAALQVETPYHIWFPRMTEYGFTAGTDYLEVVNKNVQNPNGGRPSTDHQLTIAMAKELCMLQRTERGKQCRQYFIELERRWNDPASIMARALQIADRQIETLKSENAMLLPKGEYYDALVDRNGTFNLRDTAKLLGVAERAMIEAMIEDGYLYRTKGGELRFYAEFGGLYFKPKEFVCHGHPGIQVLVTVKGREHFMRLYAKKLA